MFRRKRRVKVLHVASPVLVHLLERGQHVEYVVGDNGLPPDAKVVGIRWDGIRDVFEVGIESREYDVVPQFCEPPMMEPITARQFERSETVPEAAGPT